MRFDTHEPSLMTARWRDSHLVAAARRRACTRRPVVAASGRCRAVPPACCGPSARAEADDNTELTNGAHIHKNTAIIRQEAGGSIHDSGAYISVIHVEHAGVASVCLFHLRPVPDNQYDSISRLVSYTLNCNLCTRHNLSKTSNQLNLLVVEL